VRLVERFSSSLKEFRSFALRANALDLVIAVALGAAFTAVVQAIVQDLFTPLIAAIFGKSNFSLLYFTINGSQFHYGLVINAIVTFVAVAFMLFYLVVKPINSLRRRMGWDAAASDPKAPCPACLTDINPAARRCPSCTEKLAPGWSQEPLT
jgi:large conductance mechanosensitive channel